MHRSFKATIKRLAAIASVLTAGAVLAACGGSSTSTAASKATATSGSARFSALRECLKKQGITLPQRTPGKPGQKGAPGGGGLPFGAGGSGGPPLPSGVSREQLEAAMKKCGGSTGGRRFGGAARLSSPGAKESLAKFASCMSENGVKLPAPNTSGNGPIFDTKGLDTKSATFTAASKKCSSLLQLGGGPGGAGAPGAGGGAAPGGAG
jgi:hypothetical protein